MKILMTCGNFYPATTYGGPPISAYSLAKGLVREGIDVTVFTTNADGDNNLDFPVCEEVNINGIKVFYFERIHKNSFWGKRFFLAKGIYSALKRHLHEFDLVHIQGILTYPTTISARLCIKNKKPYLIAPRGGLNPWQEKKDSIRKRIFINYVEKKHLICADAVHFTSASEIDLAPFFSKRNPVIIPNPVDLSEFKNLPDFGKFRKKYGLSNDTIIITFIGRIHKIKGFDFFLPAFKTVYENYKKVVLVIAGSSENDFEKVVKEQINKLAIGDVVLFTGFVKDFDKLSLLRDSDIFVLPSYRENFGNAVVEAMASGLPVIVSDKVNLYKDILTSDAGLVVKCDDKEELSKAIMDLILNPEKRKQMGRQGHNFVRQNYELSKVARDALRIYENILRKIILTPS